jgi:chorismate mutase
MTLEECTAALDERRKAIDQIDREIVKLLNDRARVVELIGDLKQRAAMRVYEPKREELVFANIRSSSAGPLRDDALKRIYERIIDEMRTLQRDRMVNPKP